MNGFTSLRWIQVDEDFSCDNVGCFCCWDFKTQTMSEAEVYYENFDLFCVGGTFVMDYFLQYFIKVESLGFSLCFHLHKKLYLYATLSNKMVG